MFATAGASRIALLGRREQPLLETKKRIQQDFPAVEVFTASTDISSKKSVDSAFDRFAGQGRIDVLVSNAAIGGPFDSVQEVDTEKFMNAIHVNLGGNLNVAQAFARHAATEAVVIDISSGAAHLNMGPGFAAYSVSKMAVYRMWDAFAFKSPEISVFHTQPGVVDTDMNKEAGGVAALGFEDHGEFERVPSCFDVSNSLPVSLPAHFNLWLASPEAKFLKNKFLWVNWDVDELKSQAEEIQAGTKFNVGLVGWPFGSAAETTWKS